MSASCLRVNTTEALISIAIVKKTSQSSFEELHEITLSPSASLRYYQLVLQIVFNEISAAEISQLGTLEQLELLDEFKVTEEDLEHLDDDRFGKIERDGKKLYRFRSNDWRFYFESNKEQVIVHRVLHKGTFSDFLFRSKLPLAEDEALADSKHFWNLIDEGRNARRA